MCAALRGETARDHAAGGSGERASDVSASRHRLLGAGASRRKLRTQAPAPCVIDAWFWACRPRAYWDNLGVGV